MLSNSLTCGWGKVVNRNVGVRRRKNDEAETPKRVKLSNSCFNNSHLQFTIIRKNNGQSLIGKGAVEGMQ